MRTPPPFTGDAKAWAENLRRFLQRTMSALAYKDASATAAEDGIILWDAANGYPVVSRTGVFEPIALGSHGCAFIETQDFSATATADFDLPGGYDVYMFAIQNVIPSTDGDTLRLRTSTDGGVTFDATASDYTAIITSVSGATSVTATATTLSSVGVSGAIGTAAGEDGVSGRVFIYGPHLAKKTMITAETVLIDNAGAIGSNQVRAFRASSADVDAIRFYCDTTTIASGSITLYGFANA